MKNAVALAAVAASPKVLDFIHATNEVLQARGVKLPLEGQSTTTPETRLERSLALQKEIFGDRIDKMYTRRHPPISATSRNSCRPTASAITGPGAGWTRRRGSF
jgi:hypothetical protein